MAGKSCEPKGGKRLKIPISKAGTKNKFLKVSNKNPFTGDFF